jgi:hypothetical protein
MLHILVFMLNYLLYDSVSYKPSLGRQKSVDDYIADCYTCLFIHKV